MIPYSSVKNEKCSKTSWELQNNYTQYTHYTLNYFQIKFYKFNSAAVSAALQKFPQLLSGLFWVQSAPRMCSYQPGLSLTFESPLPVPLIITTVTILPLCGWILSTTGKFICNVTGLFKSYRLYCCHWHSVACIRTNTFDMPSLNMLCNLT